MRHDDSCTNTKVPGKWVSDKKNRMAVHLTAIVAQDQIWFFREQAVGDHGIDAIVEKLSVVPGVGDNEVEEASGRPLALQIKGGTSRFREPSDNGWWFRAPGAGDRLGVQCGHRLGVLRDLHAPRGALDGV